MELAARLTKEIYFHHSAGEHIDLQDVASNLNFPIQGTTVTVAEASIRRMKLWMGFTFVLSGGGNEHRARMI